MDKRTSERALGLAAAYLSQGDLALADLLARSVLDAVPGHPAAWHVVGAVATRLGLREQAVSALRRAAAAGHAPARDALRLAQRLPPPTSTDAAGRFLVIKAWGYGFWSDVSHVLGCLLLSELTGRTPVTCWGSNSRFGDGTGGDAFQHYFEPLATATLDEVCSPGLTAADVFPRKWSPSNLAANDIAKWHGAGSRMPGIAFLNRPERVVVSDFHIAVADLAPWIPESHPLHGRAIDDLHRLLIERHLRPLPAIQAWVEAFHARHLAGRPSIAAHLRGTDKRSEMADLDQANRLILAHLDRADPAAAIFLLTDDQRLLAPLRRRYGERLVHTDCLRGSGDTGLHHTAGLDGVRLGTEVMRDVYVALRCARFVGNGDSNVSAMIAVLRPWPAGACTLIAPSRLHRRNFHIYVTEA